MKYKILIPEIIAETVSLEHSEQLLRLFYHFQDRFPDNQKGRDLAYAFMQHWLDGYNKNGKWLGA